jgi:hypothetical protein
LQWSNYTLTKNAAATARRDSNVAGILGYVAV